MSNLPTSTTMNIGDGNVCDADNYTAEAKRLDMYMMVDDSGSMVPWWPFTLDAINMFFIDPSSDFTINTVTHIFAVAQTC